MTPAATAVRAKQWRPRAAWQRLPRWAQITLRTLVIVALVGTGLAAWPYAWTQIAAKGHLYDEADLSGGGGPRADVVLVLGSQVAPGGTEPMPFLRGRLDTAAALVSGGHAKVILVSGDAAGSSGDETTVMRSYLTDHAGVDPSRVLIDPYGLDTYDSCARANQVFGVNKALVVTQPYHLARAVALCRHLGIDADGVGARCDGCLSLNLMRNWTRDYFACSKAALEAYQDRPPAVISEPSSAVLDAVARWT
jgi:vancomycin permeability regulator SanA